MLSGHIEPPIQNKSVDSPDKLSRQPRIVLTA